MTTSCRNKLNSIISDLDTLITELEDVEGIVRYDFSGVGNERCADSIESVKDQYDYVRRTLQNI